MSVAFVCMVPGHVPYMRRRTSTAMAHCLPFASAEITELYVICSIKQPCWRIQVLLLYIRAITASHESRFVSADVINKAPQIVRSLGRS